jgi:transposase
MPNHTILPHPEKLNLVCLQTEAGGIALVACTTAPQARCPLCCHPSHRIHSRYLRTLSDLPWHGIPVTLRLHVRRFFYDERSCRRTIFAERLPELVAGHYARRTTRLDGWLTPHMSFALGGEAGARLLQGLGVTVSGDTLLNNIRSFTLEEAATPRRGQES